ncbi:hypothetical protein C5167_010700 [Papaver somniferum]|uniref:Uncharacterized protein n=1 Tax=Papaver somniferum TaxID=3469 RepID=A0A4Y7K4T4_PAPSO|nr:hypothetical protein C5167_010700 [Papaver somniferum]
MIIIIMSKNYVILMLGFRGSNSIAKSPNPVF